MLIKTQDGNYIKWDSLLGLAISEPSNKADGYDLGALLNENFFLVAHYDERKPCENVMEAIISAMFKKADIIDCSDMNIIYKNTNEG